MFEEQVECQGKPYSTSFLRPWPEEPRNPSNIRPTLVLAIVQSLEAKEATLSNKRALDPRALPKRFAGDERDKVKPKSNQEKGFSTFWVVFSFE